MTVSLYLQGEALSSLYTTIYFLLLFYTHTLHYFIYCDTYLVVWFIIIDSFLLFLFQNFSIKILIIKKHVCVCVCVCMCVSVCAISISHFNMVEGKQSIWKWIYGSYYKLNEMNEYMKLHWYSKYIIFVILNVKLTTI